MKGSSQKRAISTSGAQHWEISLRTHVGNVQGTVLAYPAKLWRIKIHPDTHDRYGTKMGSWNYIVPLAQSQYHIINATNPCRAFDNGVEDRLHVCGRPADDAEHLGRCRLVLQRFPQFRVAGFEI